MSNEHGAVNCFSHAMPHRTPDTKIDNVWLFVTQLIQDLAVYVMMFMLNVIANKSIDSEL